MSNSLGIHTAVSMHKDESMAAHDLAKQLADPSISSILFFSSASYNLAKLAYELNQVFPDTPLSGCTTAGEITPNGYSKGSITAIGFSKDSFCVRIGAVKDLKNFTLGDAQSMVEKLRGECNPDLKHAESFAITLVDGLAIDEEIFLVTLNSALGSTPSFGGSAGDDVNLANTHVFFDGEFHDNAAVVLLITTPYQFEVFSTHHLQPTETKLIVTEADHDGRLVSELNAEPAAIEYANTLEVSLSELSNDLCTLNPLAVKLGDSYYIRSIQSIEADQSLKFFCAMESGIVLTKMEPSDLIENLENTFDALEKRIGEPQLVIGCDCFLRRREAEVRNIESEISDLMRAHQVIGLNTYGEQLSGMHINQTFTAVAIGKRRRDE